ncbi:MAG: hypothetical protein KC609_21385 [Myxococcales bacterium]|nr:hypothetical protein [Myxococcales bacterium]
MKRIMMVLVLVGTLSALSGCAGVDGSGVGNDPITGEQVTPQTSTTGGSNTPILNTDQKDDSAGFANGRLKEQSLSGPTPTPVNTKVQACDPNDFSCNGKKLDPKYGEPDPWKGSDDDDNTTN